MRPGSLFWFGDNVPTGFEVPFDEDAMLVIFKTQARESDDAFLEHLRGLAVQCEEEQAAGTPFRLADLPADHPALAFAATLGP